MVQAYVLSEFSRFAATRAVALKLSPEYGFGLWDGGGGGHTDR